MKQGARVGFWVGGRLDQEEPPHHRLARAQPRRQHAVFLRGDRVQKRDALRRAEERVERLDERLRDAPEGERGVADGGGVCGAHAMGDA